MKNIPFVLGVLLELTCAGVTLRPGEVDVVTAPNAPGPVQLAAAEMTNFLSRALGARQIRVRRS